MSSFSATLAYSIVLLGGCIGLEVGGSDVAPASTDLTDLSIDAEASEAGPELTDLTEDTTDGGETDLEAGAFDVEDGSLWPDLGDGSSTDTNPADTGPIPDTTPYKGGLEWTVMVYLNGDNSLSVDAEEDLDEMAAAGWSPKVRVVVLMDTLFEDARELVLGPEGFEVLDLPGEIDMADWKVLRDFTVRSIEANPAKRYALIAWNHGDGWDKPSQPGTKSFSSDSSGVAGQISVAGGQLTAALAPVTGMLGRPLDLLGLDMCLLGMWEVAVAAQGAAEILLASEENEPSDGWEYTGPLFALHETPQMDGATLATLIAEHYHAEDSDNSTLAAIALPSLPAVNEAVGLLAETLLEIPDQWDLVEEARVGTQRFDDDYSAWACPLRDLHHLTERLDATLPPSPDLLAATTAVREAMAAAVLINVHQSSHPNAHGLAIHFPPMGAPFKPTYLDETTPWAGHPWATFIEAFGDPACSTWTCKWSWFGGGDGCDCACGCWDPDCDTAEKTYHCGDDQICAPPGVCQDAEGACEEGATQCTGDLLLATCTEGLWTLGMCGELVDCPDAGEQSPVCWNGGVDAAPGACHCPDDPVLCAGIQCGDNDFGHWCRTCRAGLLCHDGTCYQQGGCSGDEILDCLGACGDSDWIGDDICDEGEWDVVFNCETFGFDGGDCG